ncbi:conserved hypothetical protein [Desulfamplus magnetovallimortis]|uniref:Uncharacterized protein n=1 Tax=Desulfamplus magnetovallimortis TaxID=1246637 RepID=A0A1W1HI38_9BACT|nr:hypothetical protein [Desulfamplus magnetovallimortis]SLM32110.1 conserved hypothetical protein [Desulfamplus magnetovallimortis]
MKLTEQEARKFFNLMWALQYFVNKKLAIIPDIKSVDEYAECNTEEKIEVRKALYKDKKYFDMFVKENPQNFSEEDLSVIREWKNFIDGDFHIERFLKKYTVFIRGDQVYGVMGLYQGVDELIHSSHLPLYVKTVLLPYKGKIVYDGLFQSYNIYFGGGIKRELKESYMIAKQNNRIIETLEYSPKTTKKKEAAKPVKNWKPELDRLAKIAKNLRGSSDSPAIYSPAFGLIKASIEFARLAESDLDDQDSLYKSLKKVESALKKSYKVLDRQESW